MWGMIKKLAKNDNKDEISYFDVKELYEAAYAEKAKTRVSLKRFKALMNKARQLDNAYRVQLGLISPTTHTTPYKRAA